MSRLFLLLFVAIGLAAPVQSSPVEEIRALAIAGEVAAVETRMAELHDTALETGEFDALRAVNAQVFGTTHPAVIAMLADWSAEYPESPYAQAGLAWNHYHRAFLLRGTEYVGRTPPQRMAAFREEIDRAVDAAIAAFERAPDYLPASDAMIVMSLHSRGRIDPAPVFEAAMAEWPNWRTLHNMIGTVRPQWGGSVEAVLQLCADYAEAVPDYDLDACAIEAVLTGTMPRDLQRIALNLLAERNEPWLDYLRLARRAVIVDMVRAGEADRVEAMIERALEKPTVNVEDAVTAADIVAEQSNRPFYPERIRDRAGELVDAQIAGDPYNPTLLLRRISLLGQTSAFRDKDPEAVDHAWTLWTDALEYGELDPEVWEQGGYLAMKGQPEITGHLAYPYFANAAALDPFPVAYLGTLLDLTRGNYKRAELAMRQGETSLAPGDRDPFDVMAELRCPLLRLTRLIEAYCELDRGEKACGSYFMSYLEDVRDIPEIEAVCVDIVRAPVEDLLLDPVPPARITEWSPETAPGSPGAM